MKSFNMSNIKEIANHATLGNIKFQSRDVAVVGNCNANHATLNNIQFQSGYLFTLFGYVVSWKSSLQSVVALSTIETEYILFLGLWRELWDTRSVCWFRCKSENNVYVL